MGSVPVFVAVYLIAVMAVLMILSILAYRKKIERGEIDE